MCIIIAVKPGGALPSNETLARCLQQHGDGIGLMYKRKDNDRLHLYRSLKVNRAISIIKDGFKRANLAHPFCIHFRKISRGVRSVENCHPFNVNNKMGLMHNGTITQLSVKDGKSDTAQLAEMLAKLPDNWYNNTTLNKLIVDFLRGDRLLLQLGDGNIVIYNKNNWVEDEDCFYSNDTYKEKETTNTTNNVIALHEHDTFSQVHNRTLARCDECQIYSKDVDWTTDYVKCKSRRLCPSCKEKINGTMEH